MAGARAGVWPGLISRMDSELYERAGLDVKLTLDKALVDGRVRRRSERNAQAGPGADGPGRETDQIVSSTVAGDRS